MNRQKSWYAFLLASGREEELTLGSIEFQTREANTDTVEGAGWMRERTSGAPPRRVGGCPVGLAERWGASGREELAKRFGAGGERAGSGWAGRPGAVGEGLRRPPLERTVYAAASASMWRDM